MYLQYINHNRNITETVLRAIEIANFVDMVRAYHFHVQ